MSVVHNTTTAGISIQKKGINSAMSRTVVGPRSILTDPTCDLIDEATYGHHSKPCPKPLTVSHCGYCHEGSQAGSHMGSHLIDCAHYWRIGAGRDHGVKCSSGSDI